MNKYKIVSLFLGAALVYSLYQQYKDSSAHDITPSTTFNDILTRTSVRSFTSQPISSTMIDSLCRAGMAAPTAMNRKPWHFIVVTDKKLLLALSKIQKRIKSLDKAAAAIVVCGKPQMNADLGNDWWVQDCSAASENILLAAHSLGLGGVWVGVYPNHNNIEVVTKTLNISQNLVPLSIITLGYPDHQPTPKDKYDSQNISYNIQALHDSSTQTEEDEEQLGF